MDTREHNNPSPPAATRLAPSPTGALHLGNARTFLINWALARQCGWRVQLRVEDLDGPRVKAGADREAIGVLQWLGINWDGPPAYQRHDLSPYIAALDHLRDRGLAYPCTCTRSQIRNAQSAPHEDDHELRYPGTCRPRGPVTHDTGDKPSSWRVLVTDDPIHFTDELEGPQSINVQQQVGDFVVATKDALPAYQLAVVVDDARHGVTDVVRGDDLLRSTGRQILLQRLLGLTPQPRYWHVPLVLGPDGHRLAKRHGDTRISWYRQQGVRPGRLVGLLAYWCNTIAKRLEISAAQFRQDFRIDRLPGQPVTFTAEDHEWLMHG